MARRRRMGRAFSPGNSRAPLPRGVAPGWYEAAPLALGCSAPQSHTDAFQTRGASSLRRLDPAEHAGDAFVFAEGRAPGKEAGGLAEVGHEDLLVALAGRV